MDSSGLSLTRVLSDRFAADKREVHHAMSPTIAQDRTVRRCARQFELACAYDFERPKKRRLAVYWYHKAAEQGHATAQNYLGESYRDGWTVKRDVRKAIRWFRLAAEQDESYAQLSLGACCLW